MRRTADVGFAYRSRNSVSFEIYVNCINRGKQLAILRLYIIYFPEQKHQHHDKIMIYTT